MDFGQYQNNVTNLPNLEVYRYENIFKVYTTQDGNSDYFYNIIKSIYVPNNLNDNVFSTITMPTGMPFTVLSYNLYGTTYLWWLICSLNHIQNPFDLSIGGKSLKVLNPQYVKTVLNIINQQLQ